MHSICSCPALCLTRVPNSPEATSTAPLSARLLSTHASSGLGYTPACISCSDIACFLLSLSLCYAVSLLRHISGTFLLLFLWLHYIISRILGTLPAARGMVKKMSLYNLKVNQNISSSSNASRFIVGLTRRSACFLLFPRPAAIRIWLAPS